MGAMLLISCCLTTLAIVSAVAPPAQTPVVPSLWQMDHAASAGLLFCNSRTLPLRASQRSSCCPVLNTRASVEVPGFFKRALVGIERLLVTITQVRARTESPIIYYRVEEQGQ